MRRSAALALLLAACPAPDDDGADTDAVCTPGADATCNLDLRLSSLHGHCEDDGTCTCAEPYEKDAATGLCR